MRNMSIIFRILLGAFLLFSFVFSLKAQIGDAIFTNYQTNISIINYKLYITRSYELLINNRSGEEYAKIRIPYSKMNRVSKVEAYIKDKNGTIVNKLKPSDIIDRSTMADFSLYEDNFVKEFTLIHNVYPYTICYNYHEQQAEFFYIDSWTPVINKNVPTLCATLNLDIPLKYLVAYRSQFVDDLKIDTIEKRIEYHWKSIYIKQIKSEIYSPDLSNFIPKVEIVPLQFEYDKKGSQNSWIAYGNWENSLLDGLNDLPEAEKLQINSLIKGLHSDVEKVKVLYHYLQDETRYINISIKTGGMKPYPASYVSINKYGDCKALSNYFKSVLDYVGIKSFYTNVYADENRKINHDFPSQQFNHVILCVPLQKDTVWLDCTSDGPYNYLGTFTQNREAFLIDKNNSHFARTPSFLKQDVLVIRNILVKSDSADAVVASFRNSYRGQNFENLFTLSHSNSEEEKAQIIRNNLIESNFELVDYKLIPTNRDSTFILFNYNAKADKLFKNYGNDLLIGLVPFYVPPFKEPKTRIYPIQLDYPIYKIDTVEYQIPFGYSITSLGQNKNINSEFGTYKIQFKQKENFVEVVKSFLLYSGSYLLKQYPDFYKFVTNVSEIENNTYIITSKNVKQ